MPFLEPLLNASPAVKAIIEGVLPGLVIIIFFAILVSIIITGMIKLEGHASLFVIRRKVFSAYYVFVIINIFLGSTLAGGILKVLPAVLADPSLALELIASSIPRQANYFLSYILIIALVQHAMELLQIGPLIIRPLFQKLLGSTKRKYRKPDGPRHFGWHVKMAIHCLVFILCATYSTFSPVLPPFAFIYFVFAYVIARVNFVYIYTFQDTPTAAPGGGAMFPAIFARLCFAVFFYQCVIAAVLGISLFIPAVALAPIILLWLLFWRWSQQQLHSISKHGALTIHPDDPSQLLKDLDANADAVCPAPDTYTFPLLRESLFQPEEQEPSVDTPIEPAPRYGKWWEKEFVSSAADVEEIFSVHSEEEMQPKKDINEVRQDRMSQIQDDYEKTEVTV